MRYLEIAEITAINKGVLRPGEPFGVRDHGMLESAAIRPRQSVFGGDVHRTIHAKAAALLQSIAGHHIFEQGNKRTGLVAAALFYQLNDWLLDIENGDAVDLAMRVVEDKLEVEEIAAELEAHAVRLPPPPDY